MRKSDKIILWSAYFDSTKSRSQGRRVPKKLAVSAPKLDEVRKAAEKLGFHPEIVPDAAYPNTPWKKTGFIIVSKKETKVKVIRGIAKGISANRAKNDPKFVSELRKL